MPFCVGAYPENTQLGPAAGGPAGFITQPGVPIAYVKSVSGGCASGESQLFTRDEISAIALEQIPGGSAVTLSVTPENMVYVYGVGLTAVLGLWIVGMVVGIGLGLIRKL